jgi:hypothetical protein
MLRNTGWSKSLCAPDDYSTKNPNKTDDLEMAITEHIWNVDCAILNTVFENTVRRVNKCLETGGGTLWALLVTFWIVIIRCTETFWSPCIIGRKKELPQIPYPAHGISILHSKSSIVHSTSSIVHSTSSIVHSTSSIVHSTSSIALNSSATRAKIPEICDCADKVCQRPMTDEIRSSYEVVV